MIVVLTPPPLPSGGTRKWGNLVTGGVGGGGNCVRDFIIFLPFQYIFLKIKMIFLIYNVGLLWLRVYLCLLGNLCIYIMYIWNQ